jgi:hypothetical protein
MINYHFLQIWNCVNLFAKRLKKLTLKRIKTDGFRTKNSGLYN